MEMDSTALYSVKMASNCRQMMLLNVVGSAFLYICSLESSIDLIVCQDGDVRITGGPTSLEGNVEICINNSYGGICDDFWDAQDSRVACRQLGFSNGTVLTFTRHLFVNRHNHLVVNTHVFAVQSHSLYWDFQWLLHSCWTMCSVLEVKVPC